MNYISKAEEWAIELYPQNTENTEYKISNYAIVIKYNDGYIVFHTITWSVYFLTDNEYDNIMSNELLLKNKVIIGADINEEEIAYKAFLKRAVKNKNPYERINSYVILTTNTCNARCFYCYETIKNGYMSIQTAEKIISFIKEHYYKKCHITWFGGEPLKNIPLIDYISTRLSEENINFDSNIITNGSLFVPEIVEKSINLWHLTKIQITLDGPEKYYNKIKNYKDFNGNPFITVINNINYILQNSEIRIDVRINVCHENVDYIDELMNYLNKNINDENNKYSIYGKLLFEIDNDFSLLTKNNINEKFEDLSNRYNFGTKDKFIKKKNLLCCMADKTTGVVIDPNGNLHYCEHISPITNIGTLDNGFTEQDKIKSITKKDISTLDFCIKNKCKLIPVCERTHFCNPAKRCSKIDFFQYQNDEFIKKLKKTVDLYFDKIKEKGEE